MGIVTNYYDLKSQKSLPYASYVRDPYDNRKFVVEKGEDLPTLARRMKEYREEHNYPTMTDVELRDYIKASLYETASENDKKILFEVKAAMPTISQVKSFAKTLAKELTGFNPPLSVKRKYERALKCLNCKLHSPSSQGSWVIDSIHPPSILGIKHFLGKEAPQAELSDKKVMELPLGICTMCGCGLKAKIRYNVMSILAGITPEMLRKALRMTHDKCRENCWIFTEAEFQEDAKALLEKKINTA